MILKDISFQTPQENILYDDVLLHLAENGQQGETLRFWESEQLFVVLGRISKEEDDVHLDAVQRDRIPLLRRSSGGGTVLQGKGCLNYSLVLSKELDPQIADLRKSYQMILGKVTGAFQRIGIESKFCPTSDIAIIENNEKMTDRDTFFDSPIRHPDERSEEGSNEILHSHSLVQDQESGKNPRLLKKISGNAQKRSKKFILHHGTILYQFDLKKIEQYLAIPKDIPEYRQGRSHFDFVTNISASLDDIKNTLQQAFKVDRSENHLNSEEQDCLKLFLDTKEISVNLSST